MKFLMFLLAFIIFINFKKVDSYSMKKCKYDAFDNEESDTEFKCYNGGICFIIEHNTTSTVTICNCKPGFTGKQCEESTLTSCSPDPCSPNGYCNSDPDSFSYFCRCKPGFTGEHCQENINDCLNGTCYNGGSCIDGINSYKCDCMWPYIGRYCMTRMSCRTDSICKNNGICVDDLTSGPICICQPGYEGIDCSRKIDKCRSNPCLNNANCVRLNNDYKCECKTGYLGKNCQFKDICFHKKPCKNNSTCISVTYGDMDNYEASMSHKYYCQCKNGFNGINCDQSLISSPITTTATATATSTSTATATATSTSTATSTATYTATYTATSTATSTATYTATSTATSTDTTTNTTTSTATSTDTTTATTASTATSTESLEEASNTNGSFVLVVNISPNEFIKRELEIIREFEKRFGILILIKKESKTQKEMIYPFYPANQTQLAQPWTKVYFMFISVCIQNEFLNKNLPNHLNDSLCLQNNVNNINDVSEVLSELKKASNFFPKYVSNINYEAYTDSSKRNDFDDTSSRTNANDTTLTTSLCIIITAFSVGISLALALIVISLKNDKRVRAPVWFPPTNEMQSTNDKSNNFEKINSIEMQYHSVNNLKSVEAANQATKQSSWSFAKKIDQFSNMLFSSPSKKNKAIDSPTPANEYGEIFESSRPVKMRKLEVFPIYSIINHSCPSSSSSSNGSSKTMTSSLMIHPPEPPTQLINNQQPASPEFYPSPPESLNDATIHNHSNLLHPVNYKSYGLTPLMLFVMGRSKSKFTNLQQDSNIFKQIDSFVQNGADLNSKNNDGETALHLAARCGMYDICESLIRNNAEMNTFDSYGRNVLHTAVCSNELNIVKLILDHCSAVLCSNSNGMLNNQANLILDEKYDLIDSKTNDDLGDTSLIIASRLNLNNIVQLLIDYNATVNATDNEGRSALHWCSKVNNVNGALILLKSGANVNMQDNDEKTPLSSALIEMCTLEVADLLVKFDAFVSSEDEIKYNKMKITLHSLNGGVNMCNSMQVQTSTYIRNATKDTQSNLHKFPAKSVGTKRKLSDTLTSTKSNNLPEKNKKMSKHPPEVSKSKPNAQNQIIYTPPTPSPPLLESKSQTKLYCQNPIYSSLNNEQIYDKKPYTNNKPEYQEQQNVNYNYYNYAQQRPQNYQYNQVYLNTMANPGFNYNHDSSLSVDETGNNMNGCSVNLRFINDTGYFSNRTNQYNQMMQQQQQPSNSSQIYTNAAYF